MLTPFTIGSNFKLSTTVATTADSTNPNDESLRDAVISANALSSPTSTAVITLSAGTYDLTLAPVYPADDGSGGQLVVSGNVIIDGAGAGLTYINQEAVDRVFHVVSGGSLTLSGVTIEGGDAAQSSDPDFGDGGGILADSGTTLEVDQCVIENNTTPGEFAAKFGGAGIYSGGSVTIDDSQIEDNYAGPADAYENGIGIGGGVAVLNGSLFMQDCTLSGNSVANCDNAYGGAVYDYSSPLTMLGCTVAGNEASGVTKPVSGLGLGGGLYIGVAPGSPTGPNALLANSTFSGNNAIGEANEGIGGAIYYYRNGDYSRGYLYLVNDTIAFNTASDLGGGVVADSVVLENSIVWANEYSSPASGGPAPSDIAGNFIFSAGHNIIFTNQLGLFNEIWSGVTFSSTGVPQPTTQGWDPTDQIGVGGVLGTFGNNGGPTATFPLMAGSPAINAGAVGFTIPAILPQPLATDQRGDARSSQGGEDVGAFEYQYDLVAGGSASLAGNVLTYTIDATDDGPDPVAGATVSAVLPAGAGFVAANAPTGWSVSSPASGQDGTVTFTLTSGSLASGATAAFTVSVTITGGVSSGSPYTVSVNLGPTGPDTDPANNALSLDGVYVGVPSPATVLENFASPGPTYTAADFTATVEWGDGQSNTSADGSGTVSIVPDPLGGFDVVGSHTYSTVGADDVTIDVASSDGTFQQSGTTAIVVLDQPIDVAPASTPSLINSQTLQGTVLGTFLDPAPGLTSSSFEATVAWGDGTSNATGDGSGDVSVVAAPGGGWEVVGTHTYAAADLAEVPSVQVQVAGVPVANGPILAHFTDDNPLLTAADFTATVAWGDGSSNTTTDGTGAVSVITDPSGGFDLIGSHVYTTAIPGGTIAYTIEDQAGASATASAPIIVGYPLQPGPLDVPTSVTTEGQGISYTLLFTFTDPDPQSQPSDFTAGVAWGDGTGNTSTDGSGDVSIVAAGGVYDVYGTHTFSVVPAGSEFGVVVQDNNGRTTGAFTMTFTVAPAAIAATGGQTIDAVRGTDTGSVLLATFANPGGIETAADYSADINWGDGTGTQVGAGTIEATSSTTFGVYGSHDYTTPGADLSITVTIHHLSAAPQAVMSTADVTDPQLDGTGGFAISGTATEDTGTQVVATFTDPGGALPTTAYAATIAWGDGQSGPGVGVVAPGTALSAADPLPTGQGPVDAILADLRGNGRLDLVVADAIDDTVQVFFGNGDGTFQPPQTYDLGASPAMVTAADLTGDGHLDLITADPAAGAVSVLINNGNGTFAAPETLDTGSDGLDPSSVVAADLSKDGRVDLITADFGSDAVSVFAGNGDGTFAAPVAYPTGGAGPVALAVGQLNAGSYLGVVVADQQSDQVSVLAGGPGETLLAPVTYAVGSMPSSVALAELKGVGSPEDIITANTASNNVSVLLGDGAGDFSTAVNDAVGTAPAAVTTADVNGDDKLDIIAANNGSNTISVLQGNGDGTFRAAVNHAAGDGPSSLFAGDFSGSWQTELVAANPLTDTVTLLLPALEVTGDHTYAEQSSPSLPGTDPYAISVAMADGSAPTDTVTSTAMMGDLPVSAEGAATFHALPGQLSTSQVVATFTDPGGALPVSDYSATISWGDGSASTGADQIVYDSSTGAFEVYGSHEYATGGPYTITVVIHHAPDADSNPVTTPAVVSNPTNTTLSSSSPTSVFGQSVTFTATVSVVSPAVGTPGGTVLFYSGGQQIGMGTLNGSDQATFTTSALSAASHAITADYQGDTDDLGSDSPILNQVVNPATPTITWLTPTAITYGTPLSSAQLDAAAGWTIGGTAVTVNGTFTYTPPAGKVLHEGPQTLSEHFVPSDTVDYNTPADQTVVLNVQPAAPTFTGLTASQTIVYGTPTITVQGVLSAPTAIPVAQSVIVSVDGFTSTATVAAGGSFTATLDTQTIPAATTPYPITYSYVSNDPDFLSASDRSTALTVNKDATTTVISGPGSADFGQAVTITATVTANAPGSGTPTGTVTFVDATTGDTVGTATLSGGTASVTVSDLPPGAQTIVASYGGDSNFLAGATATGATVTVLGSVIVLDPKASGALEVTGGASVATSGLVEVDSSSTSALVASGSAQVQAGSIQVVGGVTVSGGASLSPKPATGAKALPDPLLSLAAPAAGTSSGSVNLGGSSTLTINPGLYTAISVSGSAKLTMNPGIYEIAGGGFSVINSAQVTGSGVTIYNAGSKYPTGTGGTYGAISFSGEAVVKLSAPTTGTYAGIVIFQSRDNTQELSFGGSAAPDLNGLVYAPAALVSVSGTVQLQQTALVADGLQVAGSGSTAPYATSSDTSVAAAVAIAPAVGTPRGPLGPAVTPPTARPGSGSRADGTSRPIGVVSTAAPVALADSSRPMAMGLAGGWDGPDSSLWGDAELLADVAVSLIAGQRRASEDSTPRGSKVRT